MPPQLGGYLLYLNGVEVPCLPINVTYGVWQIPEASFSLVPHWLLERLGAEDRVEAVIFFLDTLSDPTEPPVFRLLFEGEITGMAYTNSPHGRAMQFTAAADISILSQMTYQLLSNVDAVAAYASDPAAGVDGIYQPGAFASTFLFQQGLVVPPAGTDHDAPTIQRPFELLYNVVRGMLDTAIPPEQRSVPSINFFARWARKRNFVNRFFALPIFEDVVDGKAGCFPIIKAVQSSSALQTLQTYSMTSLDAGTFWETLQRVIGTVFCEVMMLPTAPLARVRLSDGVVIGDASTPPRENAEPTTPLRLLNYAVKPQMMFSIAPMCNVFFPSQIESLGYSENYISQPTRTYIGDSLISGAMQTPGLAAAALSFGYPKEVDAVLRQKVGGLDSSAGKKQATQASLSGKNMLVFPEEFFKGPVVNRGSVPAWFQLMKNSLAPEVAGPQTEAAAQEGVRLHALMQSYVAYEHFRARYEKRSGNLSLGWNPFVVPGFPCVILDSNESGLHMMGYVTSVTQSLAPGNFSTNVFYSMGRSFPEMFQQLLDAKTAGKTLGAAPEEPIDSVRDTTQDFDKAEQFYNALFYGRQRMPNSRKASFDYRDVLARPDKDGEPQPLTTSTIEGADRVVPRKEWEPVFHHYEYAAQVTTRPICSLEEYVRFIHGGTIPTDPAIVQRGDNRFGDDVVYFARIKKMVQGPGPVPDDSATGVSAGLDAEGNKTAAPTPGKNTVWNEAQTRTDWDARLWAYRKEMYERKAPLE